ncbi:MAG: hypothetical protein K6V73_06165 [Firmicutes bacterium]|jgi:hypothetical protein|nr:hypothetical protein [Bacillota bacterium]
MAITTKELSFVSDLAKAEAVGRKKADLFRSMVRDERVEDLVQETRRTSEEHLEQLRDIVRDI